MLSSTCLAVGAGGLLAGSLSPCGFSFLRGQQEGENRNCKTSGGLDLEVTQCPAAFGWSKQVRRWPSFKGWRKRLPLNKKDDSIAL